MKNRYVTKTRDNSATLFVPELDEHYHSIHGALQESLHVFIQAGLHQFKNQTACINVLEVGFGTGLNALLTLNEAKKLNLKVDYTSLEKYPVTIEEISQLNYGEIIPFENGEKHLNLLHEAAWESPIPIDESFRLSKYKADLKTFPLNPEQFDLIYFDAFAPSAQPDLWTIPVFESMFNCLKKDGILVTYCVKGDVRRNMIAVGFKVDKIPGPPGKREMARAYKSI